MQGVTKIPLVDLNEVQTCTICERDVCADDARASEWAAYPSRFLWRKPRP
jgi:hypothetical protein